MPNDPNALDALIPHDTLVDAFRIPRELSGVISASEGYFEVQLGDGWNMGARSSHSEEARALLSPDQILSDIRTELLALEPRRTPLRPLNIQVDPAFARQRARRGHPLPTQALAPDWQPNQWEA